MAGNTVANAWVQLMPSFQGGQAAISRELNGPLDGAGRDGGRRFGAGMTTGIAGLAGKIFAPLAAAAAGVSLVGFFKDSIGEAREAEKVSALTANAIKVTGGAANVTAEQVGKLAESISNKTGIDDEAIQSGANLLLTFKNVRNEVGEGANVFDRATSAAADLSAAGFGDISGASKTLGKALNDPIKGITALGRAGVTFTAEQKEQIKAMVEAGDTLGAQQIILGEVESQVGGAAAASATAGEKMAVAFGNLKEQVGTALLPVIDKLAGFLTAKIIPAISGFITQMQDGSGAGGAFVSFLKGIWEAVQPIGTFIIGTVVPAFGKLREAIGIFTGGFKFGGMNEFEGGLRLVNNAGVILGDFFRNTLVPAVKAFGDFIIGTVVPALQRFGDFVQANILPALQRFGAFIIANIVPALQKIGAFLITTVVPALVSMGQTIAANVVPIVQALWTQFQTNVLPVLQKVFTIITGQVVPVLVRLGQAIVPVIKFVVELVAKFLGFLIPAIINFAGPIIGFLINAIGNVIGWVANFIGFLIDLGKNIQTLVRAGVAKFLEFKDRAILAFLALKGQVTVIIAAVKAFIEARIADIVGMALKIIAFKDKVVAGFTALKDEVATRISNVVDTVKGIPGRVSEALGNLANTLKQKGKDLIQGLINGITDKIGAIKDKMSEVAGAIGDFLPGSPVKTGPLRKWNNGMAGKRLVGMLADGLSDTSQIQAAMRGLTSTIAAPNLSGTVGAGGVVGGAGVVINAYGAREEVLAAEVVKKQRQHDALMFAGV